MEIRYSREMNHNYMIIEAPEEETGYAVQMLSANAIEGLLKFRVRQTEEAREYYYEITSRQPLRRVLEKRTLSGQELRSILLGVLAVLKRVEEYLLKEEQLLLDPEYLYLEPDHFTVELCLVPGHREEAPQALSKLLGYLLERADHQDREAVVLAYNLYQISLRENYGTADLLRQLSGEDRIFRQKNETRMRGILRRRECGRIGRSGLKRSKIGGIRWNLDLGKWLLTLKRQPGRIGNIGRKRCIRRKR